MILENAHLIDDTNTTRVFPSVALLQIEALDALPEVLDVLRQHHQPLLLLLPASGDALSRADHFLALGSFLAEKHHPAFLCLVIPAHRTRETTLATFSGIAHASSLEEALQLLAHFSQGDQALADSPSPALSRRHGRVTEALPKVEIAPLQTGTRAASKRSSLLTAGISALLLLTSVMIVPLFLMPTHLPAVPKLSAVEPLGTLTFTSSGQFDPSSTQGYNDIITLSLRALPAPHQA